MAFKLNQWGKGEGVDEIAMYITSLPLKIIGEKATIDRWGKDNPDGYQRPPEASRIDPKRGSIGRYLLKELGIFPISVLVNVREKDKIKFNAQQRITDHIEFGELELSDDVTFWIIDGQHRLEALKRVSSMHEEFEDYPVPVTILALDSIFDEMLVFYIVNERQKKLDTRYAYRNIQKMYIKVKESEKYYWLKHQMLKPRAERVARATLIVDYLGSEAESPFKDLIVYPGEEEDRLGFGIRDGVFIRYISELFKEDVFRLMSDKDIADLYITYWNCIKHHYPNCFEYPEEYTLLKNTGIATFTYLLPGIYARCLTKRDMDIKDCICKLIGYLKLETPHIRDIDIRKPIDEDWWSLKSGPLIARATSEKVFRELARMFIEKIDSVLKPGDVRK